MNNLNKKVFLLCGPPSSGKNEVAEYITKRNQNFKEESFSYPLKKANKELFSLSDEEFKELNSRAILKNLPQDKFYGYSWREINIALAEEFIKNKYNSMFFGCSLLSRIKNIKNKHFIISDAGFSDEVKPILNYYGRENVFLIRLHRNNHDFKNDSRSYISGQDLHIEKIDFNNELLEDLLLNVYNYCKRKI